MKDYKGGMSSSCLECSLGEDIFVFLLIKIGVLGVLLTLLYRVVKRSVYLYGLILLFLLSTLYYINYMLFVDRVATWSTYSFEETWITIFWDSYRYFPMLMIIYVLLTNKFIKEIESINH
ncbi:hypothetical protein [Capnocytophaga granulosa]